MLTITIGRWNVGIFNANDITRIIIALDHVEYLSLVWRTQLKWTHMDWTHVPQNGDRAERFQT
jgi:hypothetical protein